MQFVLVRYVKFFLPYWFYFFIVVLIGTLCGYTLSDAYPSTRNTLKCFIFDIWGQMGYNSYIKTWWFNKIILQLYLLFPLLFLLLRNKYSIIIGFLIIILLQLLSMKIPGNIFLLTEGGLPAFYLGMSMTKINIKKENIHVNPLISWISVLSTAIILCIVIPKMNQGQNETILLRAFLAVIIVLIYSMAKPKKVKVLSFIGKHATTMYFTHSLFLIIMPQVLTWANNPIITYLTFLSISLLFAIIIRYLQTLVRYNKLQAFIVNRLIHP